MMCGLPSSGKTTWAEKTMSENRAKHYHLIGNEAIMDKMRICGQKHEKYGNVHGTPFEVLQVNFWKKLLNRNLKNEIISRLQRWALFTESWNEQCVKREITFSIRQIFIKMAT